jgi:hypothetical protein
MSVTSSIFHLRRFTLALLTAAFTFGLFMLWIKDPWPFAVFQAAITAAACVWFLSAARLPEAGFTPWLVLPFGVAALCALQIALGATENRWQTRQSMFEWTTHACVAVLAFQVCRDESLRAGSLRLLAVAAAGLALLSAAQNYSSPERVWWLFDSGYSENVFGPFVYHTKLANFAELTMPVAVWLATIERRWRFIYVACAAALAGVVVAAASRGGMIVLAAQLVILGFFVARKVKGRALRAAGAFALALLAGVSVFGWTLAAERLAIDPMSDLRIPIVLSTLDMLPRYWLHGAGLGAWSTVYPQFARFDNHLFINQAHCDWLQWLAEGGVPMLALMLSMTAIVVRSARREWWTVGLLFVWLHGAFDYPTYQTPAFMSLQMAFWGAALAVFLNKAGATTPARQ